MPPIFPEFKTYSIFFIFNTSKLSHKYLPFSDNIMLMLTVPHRRLFLGFAQWWFIKTPQAIIRLLRHSLVYFDNTLAISLMLRMLFVPIFGDNSVIGLILGIIFRSVRVLLGAMILILDIGFFAFIFLLWATSFFLLLVFLRILALPAIVAIVLIYNFYFLGRPRKKLNKISKYESPLLAASTKLTADFLSSHFIEKLLNYPDVTEYILRLGVDIAEFRKSLLTIDSSQVDKESVLELTFKAGITGKLKYVTPQLLFYAILKTSTIFDKILTDYELSSEVLSNTLNWLIYKDSLINPPKFWEEEFSIPIMGGVNRGWTARPTPLLDEYSEDLTAEAQKFLIPRPIGKEKIVAEMVGILSRSTRQNVILIGAPGCGKTSAVRGIAYSIIEGTGSTALRFKRLVSLDVGALTSGAETPGALNGRINGLIKEIKASKNIILFVDEVHTLVSSVGADPTVSSIFNTLEPHLSAGELDFIGATSIPNYKKYIEPNAAFARVFQKVEMNEASKEDTLKILEFNAFELEAAKKVVITYPALLNTVELSSKIIHDRVLPDKAVDILENTCAQVLANGKTIVTKEDITAEIAKETKIPLTSITENESTKLLELESTLHKEIIGQAEAVKAITAAMQRARVGIREEGKPIASFLFAGPTGVGKTETAKALARSYFGDEKMMIRVDMSEYQESSSVDRMVERLTSAVRAQPFSLVLLDEIEKAHPNITLLFLQVLDDGRLTDTEGRTIDFSNTLIIATSNVGSHAIQEAVAAKVSFEELQKRLMAELLTRFAPEFLNRFSGLITFEPLTEEQIKQIVKIKLAKVSNQMSKKLITIKFSDDIVNDLASKGFDPVWGARPLNRLIADKIETKIAQMILKGELKKGDTKTFELTDIIPA
ncbi:MAG: ATP-dependent Clp protease ATP-binding subunit [candidate division WWE3 bacterium]|nr:ATP-dependent Clp protease ATP-binding subunit [candidate division WWE3 bacterium]